MSEVRIIVDGQPVPGQTGQTLAAALANAGLDMTRTSVSGEPRGVLCAMGICQECRVTVNGRAHRRACMVVVSEGMRVERGGA